MNRNTLRNSELIKKKNKRIDTLKLKLRIIQADFDILKEAREELAHQNNALLDKNEQLKESCIHWKKSNQSLLGTNVQLIREISKLKKTFVSAICGIENLFSEINDN
jgi:FtsZ-binding cell division protein ZapB